jgi:hypothetical protein
MEDESLLVYLDTRINFLQIQMKAMQKEIDEASVYKVMNLVIGKERAKIKIEEIEEIIGHIKGYV